MIESSSYIVITKTETGEFFSKDSDLEGKPFYELWTKGIPFPITFNIRRTEKGFLAVRQAPYQKEEKEARSHREAEKKLVKMLNQTAEKASVTYGEIIGPVPIYCRYGNQNYGEFWNESF